MSIVPGAYPERAWAASELQDDCAAAFGGPWRARTVRALNWFDSLWNSRDPGWNADLCRRVRDRVAVPVLCEGGIRNRAHCDRLLGDRTEQACDAVRTVSTTAIRRTLLENNCHGNRHLTMLERTPDDARSIRQRNDSSYTDRRTS